MGNAHECPTCGVNHSPPRWPSPETTPWTDDCACSDLVTCIAHQLRGPHPERPAPEVMNLRAVARHERQLAEYQAKLARFKACYPDDPAGGGE
jgi:hypothetical protein